MCLLLQALPCQDETYCLLPSPVPLCKTQLLFYDSFILLASTAVLLTLFTASRAKQTEAGERARVFVWQKAQEGEEQVRGGRGAQGLRGELHVPQEAHGPILRVRGSAFLMDTNCRVVHVLLFLRVYVLK